MSDYQHKLSDLQTHVYQATDLIHSLDGHKPKTSIEDLLAEFPDHPYVVAYKHALDALTKAKEARKNNAIP